MRLDRKAQRLRIDLPLRGSIECLLGREGALLPLSLSRAAASRPCALVRRGRGVRRSPGYDRNPAGNRDPQADPWGRGPAHPEISELLDYEAFCGVPGHDRPESRLASEWEIDARELAGRLKDGDPIRLIDGRGPHELQFSQLAGRE